VKSIVIAKEPTSPRDYSRLFVYNTKTDQVVFDRFYNLDKYLPRKSFLVFNDTKVVPARIDLSKKTGGSVKVLFLVNETNETHKTNKSNRFIRGLVDKKITLGEKLYFNKHNWLETISQDKNIFTFKLSFPREKLFELLEKNGTMPIPPYIKNTPLSEDKLRQKYQTIFAKMTPRRCKISSVAAPTASLHFTDRLFKKMEKKGIDKYFITLHVGLGTFAPVTEENYKSKKLHQEYFEVDKKTLRCFETSKKKGEKLVAVGTTVVRTLETIASLSFKGRGVSETGFVTDIFIYPPYEFRMVDCLITNFHLPGSSLLLLVEAFLQFKKAKKTLTQLYKIAVDEGFRFYSFGDGMLII
jgi:S-adenosylmethionine:tRNA ribosyltransferase-isomerase